MVMYETDHPTIMPRLVDRHDAATPGYAWLSLRGVQVDDKSRLYRQVIPMHRYAAMDYRRKVGMKGAGAVLQGHC